MAVAADLRPDQTHGLVCAHHHLYSALARGMPAPPRTPGSFVEILELVWWRLDRALDLDAIEWSAKLGALEALERGTTCIIDHHESPWAIEGSLEVIAAGCAEIGVRVNTCFGVTDRHPGVSDSARSEAAGFDPARFDTDGPMTEGARRGLAENRRHLESGASGMVGVHAAFTCTDETLSAATELAAEFDVGVHIHVAEGEADRDAAARLAELSTDRWLIIHGVHLTDGHGLAGTLIHNPRSNMNNAVGYARPARFANATGLGTDGIGADMLDEFRVAYVRMREDDVTAGPDAAWDMLEVNRDLFPESRNDVVTWNYDDMDPWRLAFTTGVSPRHITVDGETVMEDGRLTRVDAAEIRAKAAEAAQRLFKKLENLP
ncbi:MAG: amidohydrolase family protein [Acidimicrobiaceae bacterium]|nr:amidohydrolase family protein [Acidimicrobiaceae bacterium]